MFYFCLEAQEVLYAYAFKNFKEAKKKFEELKSKNDNVSTLLKDVFRQIEIVETIKHCQDEQQFVDLIKDHKFQVHHINAKLLKSTAVSFPFLIETMISNNKYCRSGKPSFLL